MYRLVVKGLAGESNINDRSRLHGIECEDVFSEYFHEKFEIGGTVYIEEQPLIDKGVSGGYMRFVWEDNNLYVVVSYRSKEKLNEEELEILKDYTIGQLSDGIGESFEQIPVMYVDNKEIYLSPWYKGQKLNVTQKEI